ncbi:MAG: hypothetical protein M1839_008185 [Geoglossum umbratile]|nr:MAG: hypothetical protein M1839_008185 [Geoglossum umbratile]
MPVPQVRKRDGSGAAVMDTSKNSRVQLPGHNHETKSPTSTKRTVSGLSNGVGTVIDKTAQRKDAKESRTQRRKRKLEERGLSDGVAIIEVTKQNGEKESRTQRRKRKREEREEASGAATQDDVKRPKSTHEEAPRSSDRGRGDAVPAALPDSRRRPKGDSRSGDAAVIKKNKEGKAHKDTTLTAKEKKKRQKREGRAKLRDKERNSKLDAKAIEGSSGLDAVSEFSGSVALWKTSGAIGGRLIHADPVFSEDEKYIVIALNSALRIYSSSTSLLVRSLPLETSSSRKTVVTGFSMSPTYPNHIYVSTSRGRLEIWDWIEGTKIQRWEFESEINALAIVSASPTENKSDIIYMIEKKYEKWRIKLFELVKGADPSKTDNQTKVLYECEQQISSFKVLHEGRVVVATSGKRLVVGTTKGEITAGSYVWMEFTSPDWLTCLDVRESSKESISAKGKKEKLKAGVASKSSPAIDVVIGDIKGVIYVHSDLLNRLIHDHEADRSARLGHLVRGASRRRHWHREAVHSVKWSLDGNYILSGGSETVLVLWQLDTDKQQFLPHLSATVESIVVSPKGSSYAIRLADNSMMTLSTTELKPKASIAGIQARAWEPQRIPSEAKVKTIHSMEAERLTRSSDLPKVPSAINPSNPTQILLAVSSSQSSSLSSVPSRHSPYLQTFDFTTDHHISRQALARTNVTSLNVGPEANKIGEPNIELISVSVDGKWLASVDEWNPPKRDLRFMCLDNEDLVREQNRRREVYLKFWSWSDESKIWELVTRVDAPHFSSGRDSSVGAGRVTDMAADPSGPGFATIGMDGSVKLWRRRKRTRDGVVLKGKDSKELVNWGCYHVVRIGTQDGAADLYGEPAHSKNEYPAVPCLAYSADGSIVAASCPSALGQGHSVVHLIDTASGQTRHVRDGIQIGGIVAIGMAGPYVILVGDALVVWEIVYDTLQYGIKLRLSDLSPRQKATMIHLAVDQINNTFAVAIPIVEPSRRQQKQHFFEKAHSQLVIFDPAMPNPLFATSVPNLVTALLPAVGSKGYVVLDLAAEVRVVTAKGSSNFASEITGQEVQDGTRETAIEGGEEHDGDSDNSDDDENVQSWLPPQTTADAHDDSPPVVRQEQLAEIFDVGPSFALPAVNELFERVVGLFARKPVVKD